MSTQPSLVGALPSATPERDSTPESDRGALTGASGVVQFGRDSTNVFAHRVRDYEAGTCAGALDGRAYTYVGGPPWPNGGRIIIAHVRMAAVAGTRVSSMCLNLRGERVRLSSIIDALDV